MTQEKLNELYVLGIEGGEPARAFAQKLEQLEVKYTSTYFEAHDFCNEGSKRLQKALEPLGVQVFEDPRTEGSDMYGFLFFKKEN
jgi:hypothetical protein